jgi:hypothetical protein
MRTNTTRKHLLVLAIVGSSALFAACAANPGPSGTTPSSSAPEARHPDTKAEPGNCNFYNYYHDESKNSGGAGKCATDCDCDGMRSCASGACQGEARAQVDCNSPDRHWNEAWNPQGAGKYASDCDCDGRRTCNAGACQSVARRRSSTILGAEQPDASVRTVKATIEGPGQCYGPREVRT